MVEPKLVKKAVFKPSEDFVRYQSLPLVNVVNLTLLVTSCFQPMPDFSVLKIVISPDGTLLAICSHQQFISILDIATQATVYTANTGRGNYVRTCLSSFVLTITFKLKDIAWSPDGTRLVGVTDDGDVIVVTNNNAHSTVYKKDYDEAVCHHDCRSQCLLIIPCLVVWMRVQSQWDPCRRWR